MAKIRDCGPRELTDITLLRRRDGTAAGFKSGDISEPMLAQLISLRIPRAYYAKKAQFIRCQLHVPADDRQLGYGVSPIYFQNAIEFESPEVCGRWHPHAIRGARTPTLRKDDKLVVSGFLELRFTIS